MYCDDRNWGGVVAYTVSLVRGLGREGIEATLVVPEYQTWQDDPRTAGATIHCLRPRPPASAANPADASPPSPAVSRGRRLRPPESIRWTLGAIREARHVQRLLAGVDADLVHVQACGAETAILGARWARRGRPVVSTFHILPAYVSPVRQATPGYRLLQHLNMRSFDRAIAVCEAGRAAWAAEVGGAALASRVDVVHNGCQRPPALPPRHAARAALGVPDNAPVWLNVAGYATYKGHAVLIDAMTTVAATFPDLRLLLAGGGPLEADLRARIAERGLERNVELLGYRADIDHLAAAADFYVQSSLLEAFPITLLEMGARGLPVVSSAAGGIPELIRDGVDGRLVPTHDAPALAQAMIGMTARPAEARAFGESLQRRVLGGFLEEHMVTATAAVYRRVLDR
ncbi:MAG TPA: glycosyltransferase family 4 protein [Gemmatimonadales bacterium]|nr:glycosyltransferase family 4 protein [Gemmatimonadales bacterium]